MHIRNLFWKNREKRKKKKKWTVVEGIELSYTHSHLGTRTPRLEPKSLLKKHFWVCGGAITSGFVLAFVCFLNYLRKRPLKFFFQSCAGLRTKHIHMHIHNLFWKNREKKKKKKRAVVEGIEPSYTHLHLDTHTLTLEPKSLLK
jgi:hypothetical protein